jgi:hypothetical protein
MQIDVRRGGYGPMEGTVAVLGMGAGLLAIIEPSFWPIAAGSLALGAGLAAILVWRRRGESHPSISPYSETDSAAPKPIVPR